MFSSLKAEETCVELDAQQRLAVLARHAVRVLSNSYIMDHSRMKEADAIEVDLRRAARRGAAHRPQGDSPRRDRANPKSTSVVFHRILRDAAREAAVRPLRRRPRGDGSDKYICPEVLAMMIDRPGEKLRTTASRATKIDSYALGVCTFILLTPTSPSKDGAVCTAPRCYVFVF